VDWSQSLETLSALTPAERTRWLLGALAVVAAMAAILVVEWRWFRRLRKTSSWVRMRLMALVMTPVTVCAVLVPARAVGGPAALAVFYALLLCVAPWLWFGSHLGLGRRLQPIVTRAEAIGLALSGIAIWAIPATAIGMATFELQTAARSQARTATTDASIVHDVGPARRFDVPGAGIVRAQSLIAPPGVVLEDVESRVEGPWYPTRGTSHPTFCTQGSDVHLMWSALETPPQLRLHTRDAQGRRTKSVLVPGSTALAVYAAGPTAGATEPFTIEFRDDGFDPVVPIPRPRVFLGFVLPDGSARQGTPLQPQPGDESDCIATGFRHIGSAAEGRVDAVHLLFYLNGRPTLIGEIRRPTAEPGPAP
jgi:hypothetical protein